MARQIIAEVLKGTATGIEEVWPAPKRIGEVIQHYGAERVVDPMLRIALENTAFELARLDRQKQPRDPEAIERIRNILGQAGFNLNQENLDGTTVAA
ncbi:MAG: hypothetical protein WBB94_02205 [Candidatus Saccharimonadaceae bacterium]